MVLAVRSYVLAVVLAILSACAGPLTTAQSGVKRCSTFLTSIDRGGNGSAARSLLPMSGKPVNMLILSGGGKYGAYGAGVLKGWSEAERDGDLGRGDMKRSSITIVTGISTGALLATAATIGNAETDPARRLAGPDAELVADYQVDQADIGKERGLLTSLSSNGLLDIRRGLQPKLRAVVDRYWDRLRALPDDWKTYVGMVNQNNGRFYVVNLIDVAKSDMPEAKDCYVEFLLASAAVPLEFAPRFIDGNSYVDGGVRFGTFLGDDFARDLGQDMRAFASGTTQPKVNFRAIINGTLSPNDPVDDAGLAARCDRAALPINPTDCAPVPNNLLGIVKRSVGQIMPDQIYRDSARRLDLELDRAGVRGTTGFLYVPNARIAEQGCRRTTRSNFDRAFMGCLTRIGMADGRAQSWLPVDGLPRGHKAENEPTSGSPPDEFQ